LNYIFTFEAASSATANDGSIPYGETITAALATVHREPDKTDFTTEAVTGTAVSPTYVVVTMRFPYFTTLTAGESIGDTSMAVGKTTNLVIGDVVGVYQDDGTILWSTVASITDSTTFVIADVLIDDAAIGNRVIVPRLSKGVYNLRIVTTYSGGGDKEWDFNRLYVRDQ